MAIRVYNIADTPIMSSVPPVHDIYMPVFHVHGQYTTLEKKRRQEIFDELRVAEEQHAICADNAAQSQAVFKLCVELQMKMQSQELRLDPLTARRGLQYRTRCRLCDELSCEQSRIYTQEQQTLEITAKECTALKEMLWQSADDV